MLSRMRVNGLFLGFAIAGALFGQASRTPKQSDIDNHGHKLHVTIYAATGTAPSPTIVFESGLGDSGTQCWNSVINLLPKSSTAISYSRPGLGASEPDGELPTPKHDAEILHATLAQVAKPPYILVGHSWGGPRIRMYAAMYPDEVAGLVFVDPTDFTINATDWQREIFGPMNDPQGLTQYDAIRKKLFSAPGITSTMRDEADVAMTELRAGYAEIQALPMPARPLVVLLAQKEQPSPPGVTFPFDEKAFFRNLLIFRIKSLSAFARSVPEGTLVVTPDSSHYIQLSEPELVVWAVERVMRKR